MITIIYRNANLRHIPASAKNPDRRPLAVIEFMGGSQMVGNEMLIGEVQAADEIHCEASYMGQNLRVNDIVDVIKGGKSLLKTFSPGKAAS